MTNWSYILIPKGIIIQFDQKLGWSIKEDGKSAKVKINSQGIRANQEYSKEIPKRKIRISSFGADRVYSDNVKNDETWQSYIEKLDSNLQVINFGVSGYGVDQSYLKYLEEREKFKSDIVFIGFS